VPLIAAAEGMAPSARLRVDSSARQAAAANPVRHREPARQRVASTYVPGRSSEPSKAGVSALSISVSRRALLYLHLWLCFDGTVVKIVTEKRRGHINHWDYFWPLWQTFWGHQFPFFSRGGWSAHLRRAGNGLRRQYFPLRRWPATAALCDYGDGLLDLCIYKCSGRVHLLKHALCTIVKRHADRHDVIYKKCTRIRVSSSSRWVNTEMDGDPGPPLPLDIRSCRGP